MGASRKVPLAIIGGGPAGITAAIYAVRAGLDAELIERGVPGGQVFSADRIENFPGFPDGITGPELSERMHAQARKLGARIVQDEVTSADLAGKEKRLELGSGDRLESEAVILATGSRPHTLGVPGEREFRGRGVSYCATCDGNFFRDLRVAVIGGGNSAVQEAHMLSHLCREVFIIHRRSQFRAQECLAQAALARPNVKAIWETVVERMEGGQALERLALRHAVTGERSLLPVEGAFVYVGIKPLTDLFRGQIELTPEGHIRAGDDTRTSAPGVFAAGDVRDKLARQIATAVGDGATAIRAVEIYFIEQGLTCRYA